MQKKKKTHPCSHPEIKFLAQLKVKDIHQDLSCPAEWLLCLGFAEWTPTVASPSSQSW